MQRISLVNIAHERIEAVLNKGDVAIDATVGNGHDTLFLLRQVAPQGHVYGFDIQSPAINATLGQAQKYHLTPYLTLFQTNHAEMATRVPSPLHGKIKAIMFNLGYLPGGDKQCITQTVSTLAALSQASTLLATHGTMTVMAYPGHVGGDTETVAVLQWARQLDGGHYHVQIIDSPIAHAVAPKLLLVTRLAIF